MVEVLFGDSGAPPTRRLRGVVRSVTVRPRKVSSLRCARLLGIVVLRRHRLLGVHVWPEEELVGVTFSITFGSQLSVYVHQRGRVCVWTWSVSWSSHTSVPWTVLCYTRYSMCDVYIIVGADVFACLQECRCG